MYQIWTLFKIYNYFLWDENSNSVFCYSIDYRKTGLFWTNFMFDLKFCEDGCIYKPANCTDFLMWVQSFE